MLTYEKLTREIVGAAIEVHKQLGPGLLESAYETCLCHELHLGNIRHERQVDLPVVHKGVRLDCGYRLDILAEDLVVLEVKSIEKIHPIHEAQLLTYLRLARKKVGILLNFNVTLMKNGIKRLVL